MPRIIALIEVEDAEKWEKGFVTHGELFKSQTVTTCHYTIASENSVAVIFEAENLETYLNVLQSPETAEAMAFDGVIQENVTIIPMEKQFTP